jgi:hypothetical protein
MHGHVTLYHLDGYLDGILRGLGWDSYGIIRLKPDDNRMG